MTKQTTGTTELELGGELILVGWTYTFGTPATRTEPADEAEVDITSAKLVYTSMQGTQPDTKYIDLLDILEDLGALESLHEQLEQAPGFPPDEPDLDEDLEDEDFDDRGPFLPLNGDEGSAS